MDAAQHLRYEEAAWKNGYLRVCGVDEAGRGPLAGPVVAGALILPVKFSDCLLEADDSKKISDFRRRKIFSFLNSQSEIKWSHGIVSVKEIDQLNIYQASCLAMQRAISQLSEKPDYLLIDAIYLKHITTPQEPVIKGDQNSLAIALASIIAKVIRDDIMLKIDREYPCYEWKKNKGYPTAAHIAAINKYGATPHHRMSFQPLKRLMLKQPPLS